jgi:glycosyltransferase involved in cell wall biosynthesis
MSDSVFGRYFVWDVESDFNMNKKNIMYIFNDVSFGGAGQSLLDTLGEIRSEINPVVIIRSDSLIENKFLELGIIYYKIDFSTDFVKPCDINIENKKWDIKQSYEAANKLLPIIKKEKVDLIHINSSVSYFGAIAALLSGIPYIWHIRELVKEHYGCEFLNEELKKHLFECASKLIAISDYVKKSYYEKYGLNTLRIYNGLNIKRFKAHIDPKKDFKNIFLVAGMITPEKGQWDAICATESLIKKGISDIKLIIVGDGNAGYIWAIKKYISQNKLNNNIFFIPFQKELSELHVLASYAITCSQSEALGRVTIEAMLAGNIVIGAKSGGTTEIIGENEERGFLYKLHDSKSLAQMMMKAMKCSEDRKRMILENAQIYAEKTFDSKTYCKKIVDIYDECISSFVTKDNDNYLRKLKAYYTSIKVNAKYMKSNCQTQYQKSEAAFQILIKWLKMKQKGHHLSEYFINNNIKNVTIYGMSNIGCCLYDELENSDIEIRYIIDKNPNGMENIIDMASLDNELITDVIVVTVAMGAEQIIDEIRSKGYQKVIGINEILDEFNRFM